MSTGGVDPLSRSAWFRRVALDPAALFSLATKLLQGVGGAVTAVLVLRYFSPEVQGYYYTFSNILALQIFLELGLSAVVTTFAAHEWSKLALRADGMPTGDPVAEARLRSLARKVAAWYASAAALVVLVLPAVGLWFLDSPLQSGDVAWRKPWIALCFLASLNLLLAPVWAILLACGQMVSVTAYRLVETLARYATLWLLIHAGASLWAAVGAAAAPTLMAVAFLVIRYRRFIAAVLQRPQRAHLAWRKEILPLQLRIALSWISGYFAFALFTPAMFYYLGPVDAGRMGLTWALITGLSGIAGTWLQVQAPSIAVMAAKKQFHQLDTTLYRTAAMAVVVFLAGAAGALLALAWLRVAYPGVADRFLPAGAVAMFLLAECVHQVSMAQSTYLRAFKQEPFLGVSLASGLIIAAGTLALTMPLGAYGPASSYLVGVLFALLWGTRIFVSKRYQWMRERS